MFQAGICVEVIEHLTPKQLVDMFSDVSSVTSDDAAYLINSGEPDFVKYENPGYLDPFFDGHIVSYSVRGLQELLGPIGFKVSPIRGKTWACLAEYHPANPDNNEDVTDRIWSALPENLSVLTDSRMGSVLRILGLESARAYL